MIRPFLRGTLRSLLPVTFPLQLALQKPVYYFAKVSKKDQVLAEKKKEKEKVKQSLGGNVQEIDLNKFEANYQQVVDSFKQQLAGIRAGRLEPGAINAAQVKLGSDVFPISSLAQVSSKSANSCVVSPFDSSQIDLIEKSLKIWNDTLDIKRQDNMLVLTQDIQGKDARAKLVQRLKKLANDRREDLKKFRSSTQDELRKYKKIVPEDRLRVIEEQAKSLFEKQNKQIDKLEKQKEKELMK